MNEEWKIKFTFVIKGLLYYEGEKTQMNTTLIIMAAGIGSRFGEGIKQLAQMGPNGEIIMDYPFMMQKKQDLIK